MESIEKLREMDRGNLVACGNGDYRPDTSHNGIADVIEREIAEKYMLLPVDADGVPIHVGDRMRNDNGLVCEVFSVFGNGFVWVDDSGELWEAHLTGKAKYRHVKPDSVKELLEEFGNRVALSGHQWGLDAPEIVDEFNAKIREAVSAE